MTLFTLPYPLSMVFLIFFFFFLFSGMVDDWSELLNIQRVQGLLFMRGFEQLKQGNGWLPNL